MHNILSCLQPLAEIHFPKEVNTIYSFFMTLDCLVGNYLVNQNISHGPVQRYTYQIINGSYCAKYSSIISYYQHALTHKIQSYDTFRGITPLFKMTPLLDQLALLEV